MAKREDQSTSVDAETRELVNQAPAKPKAVSGDKLIKQLERAAQTSRSSGKPIA
jgi:hypothetical protein